MGCGVYYILNKKNGKIYVGQSIDVDRRLIQHKNDLRRNAHKNEHLQSAWNYYGEISFEFSILKRCDESELDDYEIYYISYFDSTNREKGYNIDLGGNENKHRSLETRRKISEAHKGEKAYWYGKHMSEATRKKMSEARRGKNNPLYGKHLSEATRRKISEANKGRLIGEKNPRYGKPRSEEVKQKIRDAQKGEKSHVWGTSVIEEWGGLWFIKTAIEGGLSANQLSKYTGIPRTTIFNYLRIRGYAWAKLKKEITGDEGYSIINNHGGLDFIIECIKEGKTQEDIAKELGLTIGSIQSYLKYREHSWTELREEVTGTGGYGVINWYGGLDFLIECIKEGKTQKDIAKELGLSNSSSIYNYLQDRGYSWTKLKKEILGYERKSIIDEHGGLDFLINCIKNGKTQKEVAKELGIDRNSIQSYLRNRGYSWTKLKKEIEKNNV